MSDLIDRQAAKKRDLVEVVRCKQCGFWNRDTLTHQKNDFRDWDEAECQLLGERDAYHEISWNTEADDYCSYGERRDE